MKLQFKSVFFFLITLLLVTTNMNAQPPNDHISDAIDVAQGPFPYVQNTVPFVDATNVDDNPNGNCSFPDGGVWYKFTAESDGVVNATFNFFNSSKVIFFSAPSENVTHANQLTHVDQAGNPCGSGTIAEIETTAGTTYYIFMKNVIVSSVFIDINAALTPANDFIENATDLNEIGETNYVDSGIHFQFATTTNDGGQIDCDTGTLKGIWYKLYSNAVSNIDVTVAYDPTDSVITIFSAENGDATDGSELTYVDQATNICGFSNIASINTEANTYYYIFISSQHPLSIASFHIPAEVILATAENTLKGFSFYPNPIASELNLNAKAAIDEVILYNLLGQQVFADKPHSTRKTIDMSFLQTGLYVMHVSSEGKTASYKIVKK